jgi:hypothetical protein
MSAITVIELSAYPVTCTICDVEFTQSPSGPSYGVARYEDEVVPDNYEGEWGGSPVCPTCYWVERGMHSQEPSGFLPFSRIRNAVGRECERH